MPDETYRQERRPIKQEVEQGKGQEPIPSPEEFQKAVQNQPVNRPVGEGLQMKGLHNAPPEFLEKIKQQGGQASSSSYSDAPMRVTGSAKLEELLDKIKLSTQVYEEVTLPSLGKFYDGDDGPTNGIVKLRPMTGEEEQILATPRYIKKGTAMDMIFRNCIQPNYDPAQFLAVDRTFLLIYLRGISYSKDYDVEVTCPFTDKRFSETIDLNALEVTTCPENFGPQNMHDVLPRTQIDFKYRLARGFDEQRIQEHRERRSKFDNSTLTDDTLLYRTSLLVEEIGGLTDKNELLIMIKKLPVEDVSYLRNVTSEPPFGVDTKVTLTSKFTLEDFEIELPLEANFFFPRQRRTQTQA
ncbi:MAG: hypothetical protein DWQ19_11595 [Crenarchaeota archaeon]|nr:MAG: hypothetical protein DWQ19_11595 [Thermoproteota archaeon]